MEHTGQPEKKIDIMTFPKMTGIPKDVLRNLRKARNLLKANKLALGCAQALMDGYQLQQWAAYALRHIEGLDANTAGFILPYIKMKAMSEPFTELPLRDQLRDGTLPFMSERMLEHLSKRTKEAKDTDG